MRLPRATVFLTAGLCLISAVATVQIAHAKKKVKLPFAQGMEEQKRAIHALNRLSFGPRPGDVQKVMAMGVGNWIEEQLHPERIDDSALQARLEPMRTLRMSSQELMKEFPSQQMIRAVAEHRQPAPSDPMLRAIYQAQMAGYEERQDLKQESSEAAANASAKAANESDKAARRQENRLYADVKAAQLEDLPPKERLQAVAKMTPEEAFDFSSSVSPKARADFEDGMTPEERENFEAIGNPRRVVTEEMLEGRLLRDIYSQRQLLEVMTDFWFNHFNVFIGKGADRNLLTSYERDVIRPHALGKFEDLLVATARSPAMLFYLDNWLSVGPDSDFARGVPSRLANPFGRPRRFPRPLRPRPLAKKRPNGLNENYGRELMELHTLGVNGGYTQRDVTEVARVLTGWTIRDPGKGGDFFFDERKHEPGDKYVLGHRIKGGGEREGLQVLHLLAHHPSTAHFICTKLAVRFVSDNPPPALVERMAHTFMKKDGDIREVLRTMFESPEFWAADDYRAKVKTPLEFVVSAVRASGAEVSDALPLLRALQAMGMPLYGAQPPTGYAMTADVWMNSSALLDRMNFAIALAGGRLRGTEVDSRGWLGGAPPGDPAQVLTILENRLLDGDVSKQTHDTIATRLQDPKISQRKLDDPARAPDVGIIAGLLLGSPEFQRR
jgi:uncharacterized protein (DUF1800 family)